MRWTVDEVPLPKLSLFALDNQYTLATQDEETFLPGFRVVHRHRLSSRQHVQVDAELREASLALEAAKAAELVLEPARLPRVYDKPALPRGDQPSLGLLQRCFGSHRRIIESSLTAGGRSFTSSL
jgi:hypothetical protein